MAAGRTEAGRVQPPCPWHARPPESGARCLGQGPPGLWQRPPGQPWQAPMAAGLRLQTVAGRLGSPRPWHGRAPEPGSTWWVPHGATGHPWRLTMGQRAAGRMRAVAGRVEPACPWHARPPESGGAWRGLREAPRQLRRRPWRQHAASQRWRQLPPRSQEGCERCAAATRSWGSPAGAMRPYGCLRRPAGRVAAAARHGGARPEGRWVPVRAKPSSKRPSPCRPSCGPLSQVPLAQGKEQWRCEGCS
mmetsp:Transcript_7192/g.18583  ORF Transcript_7192/g.18583 Transcript_7192/m.18583 type:complete len:247 (-) Transcript_7192:31-771(-)